MRKKQETRLTANISAALHRKAKAISALNNMTLTSFLEDAIENEIEKFTHHEPNDLTRETLDKSLRGEDVKAFDSLDDLFEDIGI